MLNFHNKMTVQVHLCKWRFHKNKSFTGTRIWTYDFLALIFLPRHYLPYRDLQIPQFIVSTAWMSMFNGFTHSPELPGLPEQVKLLKTVLELDLQAHPYQCNHVIYCIKNIVPNILCLQLLPLGTVSFSNTLRSDKCRGAILHFLHHQLDSSRFPRKLKHEIWHSAA